MQITLFEPFRASPIGWRRSRDLKMQSDWLSFSATNQNGLKTASRDIKSPASGQNEGPRTWKRPHHVTPDVHRARVKVKAKTSLTDGAPASVEIIEAAYCVKLKLRKVGRKSNLHLVHPPSCSKSTLLREKLSNKWAILGLIIFIFVISTQLMANKCSIKLLRACVTRRSSGVESKPSCFPRALQQTEMNNCRYCR